MIKEIRFKQYKKLKEVAVHLSKNVTAISGENGTCKSSILHVISNSYKKVDKNCDWVKDKDCLTNINGVNSYMNPKIESLARETMGEYRDPAVGVSGSLYSVEYFNNIELNFRRHNAQKLGRYSLKPKYGNNMHERLPSCPVIYLGLPRLVPYGEFDNDAAISKGKKSLPGKYQKELINLYKDFTNYDISLMRTQKLGDLKYRTEFTSCEQGIDSNTISAGQDNLFVILTALISLRYYFDSIESKRPVESILLIDEIDATLHPAFQIKLLKLLREYSENYKIQIVFTTHSLTTLEDSLNHRDNVLYLVDLKDSVSIMSDPDIYKIKMQLQTLTAENIFQDKIIPVFTEDKEARLLLDFIFNYFENKYSTFRDVRRFFYMIDANIGADSLRGIFKDDKLIKNTGRAICILDGDQNKDLTNCIASLPGTNFGKKKSQGLSPEKLLFKYSYYLYSERNNFWINDYVIRKGFSKTWYEERIKKVLDKFEQEKNAKNNKPREFYKKLFNDNIEFFKMAFKHWLNNPKNESSLNSFYFDLRALFKKVAPYNEINPQEWRDEQQGE
ncbi:ATP-binding protein [Lactobacillus delbrueckii subsp. bulgaricus]|uniref:ATP-dependent nuclease n=1 Tax=Lactobacillus delbrueckii TaxID=1584 RepID=UPI00155EA2A3|nr:AAA family ATPase [Lactobacillus delbrueckii]NRD07193.1 ATP-binding protein [Lactobacillus delbrueckii subsp. bulgaricus]